MKNDFLNYLINVLNFLSFNVKVNFNDSLESLVKKIEIKMLIYCKIEFEAWMNMLKKSS
jgi:hypothetical protein